MPNFGRLRFTASGGRWVATLDGRTVPFGWAVLVQSRWNRQPNVPKTALTARALTRKTFYFRRPVANRRPRARRMVRRARARSPGAREDPEPQPEHVVLGACSPAEGRRA